MVVLHVFEGSMLRLRTCIFVCPCDSVYLCVSLSVPRIAFSHVAWLYFCACVSRCILLLTFSAAVQSTACVSRCILLLTFSAAVSSTACMQHRPPS